MGTRRGGRALWVFLGALCALVAASALGTAVAECCDEPVYSYAYDNWPADPWELLYFHRPGATLDEATAQALKKLNDDNLINLIVSDVDVTKMSEWPEGSLARRAWDAHKEEALPLLVLVASNGYELFAGRLSAEELGALATSPMRQKIARLLSTGKHGVFLLLTGEDAQKNELARKALAKGLPDPETKKVQSSVLVLDRKDPKEKWLVRQLLAVREDLPKLTDPMVFVIFARAYVLDPFVGEGITADNIGLGVQFLEGPCTCDYAGQLQGLSLLVRYDWDAYVTEKAPVVDDDFHSLLAGATVAEQPKKPRPPTPVAAEVAATVKEPPFVAAGIAVAVLAVVALVGGWLVLRRRAEA